MNIRDNLSPYFTSGRRGVKTDKIIIHHAATTSFDGIGATFKTRGVSAHYGCGQNRIDRYVHESNIAWHAGNWNANTSSIGIENVNSTGAPSWLVDDSTFNTLIGLVRDIANRHGLLPLQVGKNLYGHKDFSATACPASLYARLQQLATAVNGGTPSDPAPTPPSSNKSISTIADEVIAGKWSNGTSRKANLERAGYNYAAVQNEVNRKLGGGSAPAPQRKSVSQLADEVIQGAWGSGDVRKKRIQAAGYDYHAVQSEVNRKLGVGTTRKATTPSGGIFGLGQTVQVIVPVDYNGRRLSVSGNYTVMEVRGDRIVIGKGGQVTAAVKNVNLRKV